MMSEIPPDISLPNASAEPRGDRRETLLMWILEEGCPKEIPYLSQPLFSEIASCPALMVQSLMHSFVHESERVYGQWGRKGLQDCRKVLKSKRTESILL